MDFCNFSYTLKSRLFLQAAFSFFYRYLQADVQPLADIYPAIFFCIVCTHLICNFARVAAVAVLIAKPAADSKQRFVVRNHVVRHNDFRRLGLTQHVAHRCPEVWQAYAGKQQAGADRDH